MLRSGLKAVGDGRFQNLVSICQRSIAVAATGAFHCSLLTFVQGAESGDEFAPGGAIEAQDITAQACESFYPGTPEPAPDPAGLGNCMLSRFVRGAAFGANPENCLGHEKSLWRW